MVSVAGTVVFLSLTACSSLPDANRDPLKNNRATFNQDLKECQEDYPETSSGTHIRQWEGCMKLKGWQ
jgi:hypothetical protein